MESLNSKILLLGEYSLIGGSRALAIPYTKYCGSLRLGGALSKDFIKLHAYLSNSSILSQILDLDSFLEDIERGLFFDSNIAQGMGIGSSGALCAAIYKKYLRDSFESGSKDISVLMDHMSLMESFYHGSSSGLDPLVSLINRPLIVQNRNKITVLSEINCSNLYLFNTNQSRKTSAFVMYYMELKDKPGFSQTHADLVDINESLISAYELNDFALLDKNFYELSKWQYLHFSKMIHDSVKQMWLEGLESKEFFFKLCGAGGGGHYLVYSRDTTKLAFKDKLISL